MSSKQNNVKRTGYNTGSETDKMQSNLEKRNSEIAKSSYSFRPRKDNLKEIKKNQGKARFKFKVVTSAVAVFVLLLLMAVLYDKFCIVSDINIVNCDIYDSQIVIKKSGIEIGDKMFDFSQKDVNNKLCEALPYIKDVKIVRLFPDKVEIHITKENPSSYVSVGDSYYIISDSLKVLKRENDKQKLEDMKLMHVYTSKVNSCIVGKQLEFRDEDMSHILKEIIANLKNTGVVGLCDELDIRNKFEVSFLYNNKYVVELGEGLESKLKIDCMLKIVETLSETDYGIIYVSDMENNQGSFVKK